MKILERLIHKIRGEQDLETLKKRGLVVGKDFNMLPGCSLDSSHCWLISIGDNVTLAPRVRILAHDASTKMHLGYTRINTTKIGNKVSIGANAIVLPGVTIGDNVIIGAGSVVTHDVESGVVVAGNPAKVICSTEKYIEKQKSKLDVLPKYSSDYTVAGNISSEQKRDMIEKLNRCGGGFVV